MSVITKAVGAGDRGMQPMWSYKDSSQKGFTLGLMLLKCCCRHLEILNKFVAILKFFITRDQHFHFALGLTNYIACSE